MANVINRTTKQYLISINTTSYSVNDWIINPIVPNVAQKYWKISGDTVLEMTQSEKDQVDSDLQAIKDTNTADGAKTYCEYRTPLSSTDSGTKGQICVDDTYIYFCIDINSWKRVSLEVF